jgi:hypothetical protein
VLLVVVGLIAAAARPVEHAASSALRVVVEALEITGLVIVSAIGLAALAGLAVLGVRVRRRMLARPRPYRVTVLPGRAEPVAEPARAEVPVRVVPALPRADASAYPQVYAQPHVVTSLDERRRRAHRDGGRP